MPARVLIIDDSSATRMLLGGIVKGLGHEVIEASQGEEGWSLLEKSWPVHAVLLDWHMQPLDGYGFLERVRAHETFKTVKVVMVSAESDAALVRQAALRGLSGYILKPFNKELVAQRLAALGISA